MTTTTTPTISMLGRTLTFEEAVRYQQLENQHAALRQQIIETEGQIDPLKEYPELDALAGEMFAILSGGKDSLEIPAAWIEANAEKQPGPHGGKRKGAGRPPRKAPKAKPVWCGQITEAQRDLIIVWLTPEERLEALIRAAEEARKRKLGA